MSTTYDIIAAEVVPAIPLMPRVEIVPAAAPAALRVETSITVDEAQEVPKRKKITNIRDLREGMRVCGVIDGCEFEDGMIRFGAGERGSFFICQDVECGHRIDAKLRYGYDYSWAVHFNALGAILFYYDSDANEDLELYAADCASDAD